MAFDGIVTKLVVDELCNKIVGGKINKVFEPNKNEIILDIYNKEKFLLDICIDSSNCRLNLTTYLKVNPKVAPNFCMLLRKYLIGAIIKNIYSYELDRIVVINFETYNELNDLVNYKLVIELMGKHSNIILLNNDDVILDSNRHISSENALRTILPANPYTYPTSNKINILKTNLEDFIKLITFNKTSNIIEAIVSNFTGMSKTFVKYTINLLNIDENNYTTDDLSKIYYYILEVINNKKIDFEVLNLNNKSDFTIKISSNESQNSLNKFIDDFYFKKENDELFKNYKNNILKLILSMLSKYNKKLDSIHQKLEDCKNMNTYKLYGELITSNLYKINNNINCEELKLENYYDSNNILTIPLDKKYSPSYNAKLYFKKYNKLKNTQSIVSVQKENIEREISYLETIVFSISEATTIEELNEIHQEIEDNILGKKNKKTNANIKNENLNIIPLKINDFTVYIGKNNKQNDYITFKLSDKNDIWFHVQNLHGSHVLLKTNNTLIPDNSDIIYKCAKLAALHSKASNEKKVAVDYTLIKNVKKTKASKPGFVIFNNYKTIIVEN